MMFYHDQFTLPVTRHGRIIVYFCALWVFGFSAYAQQSVRPSNSTAAILEVKAQPPTFRNYNVKIREVTMDASALVEFEFNDNVGISETNRQSDLVIRPMLRLDSTWKVTKLNTLNLGVGIGYGAYMNHSDLNSQTLTIDPGSALSFDVHVGDNLRLNFHDKLTIVQNPVDEPSLSDTARFDRLNNSAGVGAYWRLNDVSAMLGYDHFTYKTLGGDFSYMDRSEEQFLGNVGFHFSDAFTAGIQGGASFFNYEENFNNDGSSWHVGIYFDAALSPYTKVHGAAGWQVMSFGTSGKSRDPDSQSASWYANFSIANRLNQYWSHALVIGREGRLGLAVNYSDYFYVRYNADWRVNNRTSLNLATFIEKQDESGGKITDAEYSFRYGFETGTSYRLNKKTSIGLRYRFSNKDSNLKARSYYQNLGTISVNYDF